MRKVSYQQLFDSNHISENIYFDLNAQLDLQQDALEFPEVTSGRSYRRGLQDTRSSFRHRLSRLSLLTNLPFLNKVFRTTREDLIYDRYTLLKARQLSSDAVIDYLNHLDKIFTDHPTNQVITAVKHHHQQLIKRNQTQAKAIAKEFPHIVENHQRQTILSLIHPSYSVS